MRAEPFLMPAHIAALPERRAQIDGLRAIAMAGVLYVHFWNDHPVTEFLRVSLFFTVSGFLITHMLWKARAEGGALLPLNFYIRRALRLFPALAVLVAFGILFDIDGFRGRAFWHLFQLSNLSFPYYQDVRPFVTGHLWSLNVLEQFYLIWPLVLFTLVVPDIYLVIVGLWILIVFLRVNAAHFGALDRYAWSTLAADPILMGALTYLLCQFEVVARTIRSALPVLISLIILILPFVLWKGFGTSASFRLLVQPALGILVAGAFFGYGGPVGRLFESRPIALLSRISYGVYMYHLLVLWIVREAFPGLLDLGRLASALVLVALTIVFASLSWYLIEAPLAALKDRFPTRRTVPLSDRLS